MEAVRECTELLKSKNQVKAAKKNKIWNTCEAKIAKMSIIRDKQSEEYIQNNLKRQREIRGQKLALMLKKNERGIEIVRELETKPDIGNFIY
jgi:hypothetical protein